MLPRHSAAHPAALATRDPAVAAERAATTRDPPTPRLATRRTGHESEATAHHAALASGAAIRPSPPATEPAATP